MKIVILAYQVPVKVCNPIPLSIIEILLCRFHLPYVIELQFYCAYENIWLLSHFHLR